MTRLAFTIVLLLFPLLVTPPTSLFAQQRHLIVVVGAAGEPTYQPMFAQWAERWLQAAQRAGVSAESIGVADSSVTIGDQPANTDLQPSIDDRDRLQQAIQGAFGQPGSQDDEPAAKDQQLWLVMIGHGTFDGKQAKFNLQGPDVTAEELKLWLDQARTGPAENGSTIDQIVINCASSSSPFVNTLAAAQRIVISATQHQAQFNFTRFGDYLSQEVATGGMDLDKDQRVSLLEWVLAASSKTQDFYKTDKRLATELALIDDNFDGKGTPADWFTGIRVDVTSEGAVPDGYRANQVFLFDDSSDAALSAEQRQMRDDLESQLEALRAEKNAMPEAVYYSRLESLLIPLGRLYLNP